MSNSSKSNSQAGSKRPETPAAGDPEVACTVLIAKTRIREVYKAKGAKIRLPMSQAKALASLEPPRVSIDGV